MNAQIAKPTRRRKCFTWLCALSPMVLLFIGATMALHIRLGFGYWPAQILKSLPTLPLAVHDCLFVAANFFTMFALIHLLVTLIHHRELGFRLRQVAAQMLVYFTSFFTFFTITVNVPARFVTWFLD